MKKRIKDERNFRVKNVFLLKLKDKLCHISKAWDAKSIKKDEAIEYAHVHINPEPEKPDLTGDYSKNTYYKLAYSGETINNALRTGENNFNDIMETVKSNFSDEPLILYRGVCEYVYGKMIQHAEGHKEADYIERGFLCCSLVKDHHIKDTYCLRISVPKHTPMVYMGNVSNEQDYYEVDILCGAKLKIVSIDKEFINCVLVGFTGEYTK